MNLRNLEQIQEGSDRGGLPLGTLFLSALAGGALVIAVMLSVDREAPATESETDPLAELLAKASKTSTPPLVVPESNVTFPKILSDDGTPTTALLAVKDEQGRLIERREPEVQPEATNVESLPKTTLPAGDLLSATRVTTQPNDQLGQLARDRVADEDSTLAPPGEEGGYEIQVASFQNPAEADTFVEALRKRGHRAYRQAAYVPERGLWHRVRIGPFTHKYQAQAYQKKVDAEERLSSFLVDPEKIKRQDEVREHKRRTREKKDEKQSRAEVRLAE